MIPAWILAIAVVVLVLGSAYGIRNQMNGLLGFGGPAALGGVGGNPTVWWYVDDYQANTKEWVSFEDRATREPTEPYLKLCMKKAQKLWGSEFNVVPVIGRGAALAELKKVDAPIPDGAMRVPSALWMPWIRSAMLAHLGGLWLDGSVLPLASGTEVRRRLMNDPVLTFGADADEELASAAQDGSEGGPAAGRSAGWAAVPGHPMWVSLSKDIGAVIQEGDQSWSSFEARRSLRWLWSKHCSGMTRVDRKAEVSRDMYGKRLQYEDLFEKTEWPTGSTELGLWLPLPDGRDKLEMASPFLWFTRLSEEQIGESEFFWARLATRS
jgi:hypothetical protein